VFREEDWLAYCRVNQRFADAVVGEARSEDPVVLVQDYHFALVPAMIRARLPRATILTFWHIPWPNPESFGICPWRREIVEGMLGSTSWAFHTRFHCKNFIETVDRYLEARIEHEHSTICFHDQCTFVEKLPDFDRMARRREHLGLAAVTQCRRRVIERLGLAPDQVLAVGVDRFDYTKGILSGCTPSSGCWKSMRSGSGVSYSCRSPAPRAVRSRIPFIPGPHPPGHRADQPALRPRELSADSPAAEHHDHEAVTELYRAADVGLVNQPARRHEPGLQGIRRCARR